MGHVGCGLGCMAPKERLPESCQNNFTSILDPSITIITISITRIDITVYGLTVL